MHRPRCQIAFGTYRLFLFLVCWIIGGDCGFSFANAQQPSAKESATASLTDSDEFYRPSVVQSIHVQVRDDDLDKMKAALPQRIYVPATFRCGQQTIDNVGLRYKGNSSSRSRQRHKRSFLIKFSEFETGQTFLGLKRVALDNGVQFGSLFSEPLMMGVLRDLGIKAPRCNFAKLHLNGKYHGVYVNVERIDPVFVKRHFDDGSGALYKVDEGGAGATLGPLPPQLDRHILENLAFEAKSSAARDDARDVLELIRKINQTPAGEFVDVMENTMHMDAFLQTMAVMLFSGAFDQLTGWHPHNYYLYHEPQSHRWHYVPWDLDVGFADNAFRRIPVISGWNAAWPIPGGPPRPLIERIVNDPQLLAQYRRGADAILEKYFHPKVLIPKVDALYEQIKDDLANDPFPHRRATNPEDSDYESIVASIKEFVRRRYDTARTQLDSPGVRPTIIRNSRPPGRSPQPGPPSLDAPTRLRVEAQTDSSIRLKWKDNAKGEVAHIVQRAAGQESDDFRNYIGQQGDDITTASDQNVARGQTYRYRVYAIHASPEGPRGSGVSNTITVRVPDN